LPIQYVKQPLFDTLKVHSIAAADTVLFFSRERRPNSQTKAIKLGIWSPLCKAETPLEAFDFPLFFF